MMNNLKTGRNWIRNSWEPKTNRLDKTMEIMLKRQISSKEIDRRSSTREVVRDNSTEKVALEIEDTNRVKDLVRDKKPKMSRWR